MVVNRRTYLKLKFGQFFTDSHCEAMSPLRGNLAARGKTFLFSLRSNIAPTGLASLLENAAINIPFLRNSRGFLRFEKFVAKVGSVANRTYRVRRYFSKIDTYGDWFSQPIGVHHAKVSASASESPLDIQCSRNL